MSDPCKDCTRHDGLTSDIKNINYRLGRMDKRFYWTFGIVFGIMTGFGWAIYSSANNINEKLGTINVSIAELSTTTASILEGRH